MTSEPIDRADEYVARAAAGEGLYKLFSEALERAVPRSPVKEFDPTKHLIGIERTIDKGKATERKVNAPYLPCPYRVAWMRAERPEWSLDTEIVEHGQREIDVWTGTQGNRKLVTKTVHYIVVRATVLDENGRPISRAMKWCHSQKWEDYIEKAETGAVGRALALAGYGTQFAEVDFEEGGLADSPIPAQAAKQPKAESANGAEKKQQETEGTEETEGTKGPSDEDLAAASMTRAGWDMNLKKFGELKAQAYPLFLDFVKGGGKGNPAWMKQVAAWKSSVAGRTP